MSFTTARLRKTKITVAPPHLFGKLLDLHNSAQTKKTNTNIVLTAPSLWTTKKKHIRIQTASFEFFSGRSFEFQAILLKRLCGRSISTGFRLSNLKPVVDPRLQNMLIFLSFEPTTPWTPESPVTVGDVSLLSHPRLGMKIPKSMHLQCAKAAKFYSLSCCVEPCWEGLPETLTSCEATNDLCLSCFDGISRF